MDTTPNFEFDFVEPDHDDYEQLVKVPPQIGTVEPRMYVRGYSFPAKLPVEQSYSTINIRKVGDLFAFSSGAAWVVFSWEIEHRLASLVGVALREKGKSPELVGCISHVPNQSIPSRLFSHFPQIIAN